LFLGGAEGEDEFVAAFGEDRVVVFVVVSFVERFPPQAFQTMAQHFDRHATPRAIERWREQG
jgi:hypothetical protein